MLQVLSLLFQGIQRELVQVSSFNINFSRDVDSLYLCVRHPSISQKITAPLFLCTKMHPLYTFAYDLKPCGGP